MKPHPTRLRPAPEDAAGPTFRSGAVAKLVGMPVATLRIWEQRYGAVQPTVTASGHRLYSLADVQRVMLLRQLTGQGYAISTLAALDPAQLQQVAQQASQAAAGPGRPHPRGRTGAAPAAHLAVVGPALAARLQRPALARHLAPVLPRMQVFATLADAARAGARADLLVWHAPELRAEQLPDLHAAQSALGAERVAVVYRFAASTATRALAEAHAALLREPADDDLLGPWLASIEAQRAPAAPAAPEAHEPPEAPATVPAGPIPPRRYDDATLTTLAGLSPTLACECPRHVAELLMQLSSFEAYSATCSHRDRADAQLHADLQRTAGTARALFEAALERLAQHEGLPLR